VERLPCSHGCRVRRVGVGSDGSRTEHVMALERNFALGAPQYDDLTALVLRYKVT
jgi:hypothetical protein